MKATANANPKKELVAVVSPNGEIYVNVSVPILNDRNCYVMSLGTLNVLQVCGGDLDYWADQEGHTAIHKGDSVTLQF